MLLCYLLKASTFLTYPKKKKKGFTFMKKGVKGSHDMPLGVSSLAQSQNKYMVNIYCINLST